MQTNIKIENVVNKKVINSMLTTIFSGAFNNLRARMDILTKT